MIMVKNQDLKTVVHYLWEMKLQEMQIMILAVTTVNMEVKRLSMKKRGKKKKGKMMKVRRGVRYQIRVRRKSLNN